MCEEMSPIAILDNEATATLFRRLWDGDASLREVIVEGNMHRVWRLAREMDNLSKITAYDFAKVGRIGLANAVDKFNRPELAFAPDASLQGGYALFWVAMQFAKLAAAHGYEYDAPSNKTTPEF